MELSAGIEYIKGVGPKVGALFAKLGIFTVEDLLFNFPRRYNDYSKVIRISNVRPGSVSIKAKISEVKSSYIRGGLHITEAVASDGSGKVKIVWFNQPYREASIKKNEDYFIAGKFEFRSNRYSIINPVVELESEFPLNTARIVSIYRETKGLTSRQIRKIVGTVLSSKPKIAETLPDYIKKQESLISRSKAVFIKHFPESVDYLAKADERLGFEELFELILASQYAKKLVSVEKGIKIEFDEQIAKKFTKHLPFKLTESQKRVVWQIFLDMKSGKVMNRLLEGDVGAGKTVVATMAATNVMSAGFQVAFMAPTELLARQHLVTISELLKPFGWSKKVTLLVGGMTAKQKNEAHSKIDSGQAQIIVGTHAIIQEKVNLNRLGLVIVDEQHRFGVKQRKKLLAKAGQMPHMLSMTATPIPRSLALTVFGELDISILDQKPTNMLPIITKLVKSTDRLKLYDEVKTQLNQGRQVFVVCPLIEESDILKLKSAEETYKEIKANFAKFKVGLLHGKQKSVTKTEVMADFVARKLDILVSTTVIEVGVDVPNATIMLIEAPERFGLAQLHQLRGRVGRGVHQGHCYLMQSDASAPSKRLRAIESSTDGFKLAELDLEIRGAGALYGTLQHGELDLKIADFTDAKLIARARQCALNFLEDPQNLLQYSQINERINKLQSVVHLN